MGFKGRGDFGLNEKRSGSGTRTAGSKSSPHSEAPPDSAWEPKIRKSEHPNLNPKSKRKQNHSALWQGQHGATKQKKTRFLVGVVYLIGRQFWPEADGQRPKNVYTRLGRY